MNYNSEELNKLYIALKKIGEQEQSLLQNIFDRLSSLENCKQIISELIWWSKQLRETKDWTNYYHIKVHINTIRKHMEIFKDVLNYEKKENAFVVEEKPLISEEQTILSKEWTDFLEAKEKGLGETALKKIEKKIKLISNAIEKLHEDDSFADKIHHILDKFEECITDQKRFLERTEEIFQWYEQLNSIDEEELIEKEKALHALLIELIKSLYLEKNECFAPLQKLFKNQKTVRTQVHDLITKKRGLFPFIERNVITFSDIKEDLSRFTRPEEVLEYQALLLEHSELLDDPCKKALSRYGLLSTYKSLKEKKELSIAASEAMIDPLTNCFTKGYFLKKLPETIKKAASTNHQLCLVIFDGDKFKEINDKYGHPIGDKVLQFIGRTIRKTFKSKDLPFRFGGEEFIIIFYPADFNEMTGVVNRLRIRIEEESSNFYRREGISDKLTISGGLAVFQGTNKVITLEQAKKLSEELLSTADIALYEAKRRGRNRIHIVQKPLSA